jgi:zinc protease
LEKVRPEDAQKFYDTYYQPNNATLIVVGDLEEAQVRKLAQEHFGSIPRGPAPPRERTAEPPQTAPRRETLEIEVQVPIVVQGFHIPRAVDADVPALEVLAAVLSGGESSRLHQRLVRADRVAIAAGGFAETMEDPGLFIVYAAYLPDRDPSKVQQALGEEIARVREKPVSAQELEKAKNQLASSFIFGLQTVDGIATALGQAQYVYGDWREFPKGASRYLAVTAADVTRVARKYLVESNLTAVTLQPAGKAPAPAKGVAK